MVTVEEIEASLFRCDSGNLPENFIAAAILVETADSIPHDAILARYQGEPSLFHYTGTKVKFQPIEDATRNGSVYYVKGVNFIEPILLTSFINRCKKIAQYAEPKYGYFYDPGSHYDNGGRFINPGRVYDVCRFLY